MKDYKNNSSTVPTNAKEIEERNQNAIPFLVPPWPTGANRQKFIDEVAKLLFVKNKGHFPADAYDKAEKLWEERVRRWENE